MKNLKTIISTNLGLKEIYQEYSERIFSRIIENFEILRFFGRDIRAIKSREKSRSLKKNH
jgi:DNA replication protein DnaC